MSTQRDLLIGCVGKPSAGKSSFLNAATDANAKVGNYPFTTIEPNHGVTYYQVPCPCAKYDKQALCKPRYGKCSNGTRHIPVQMLDVAGLVPGASEGKGLGNKFLNDLREADVLLHIIDVSGTTNEKGEATKGYNPINDIKWLDEEIHAWIFGNLWRKWGSIVRRHTATNSQIGPTLQAKVSGYGARLWQVLEVLEQLPFVKDGLGLEKWSEEHVHQFVAEFLKVRFPTIYVLNKIDSPHADGNITNIIDKYGESRVVLTSALGECFLKKMRKTGYIRYEDGAGDFAMAKDEADDPPPEGTPPLKVPDPQLEKRLEKLRDLVLFRYGSTGVQDAIAKAVNMRGFVPAYPVKNIHNFTCDRTTGVFRDCFLLPPRTTVREFAHLVDPTLDKYFAYAEGVSGQRLGEDECVTEENNIIKFTLNQTEEGEDPTKAQKPANKNKNKNKGEKKKGDKEKEAS